MKLIGKFSFITIVAAFVLALGTPVCSAQGRHPAYIHSLSDLRYARALLQKPDGGKLHEREEDAVHEINKAIDEIKKAAADTGKDLDEHPPIDANLNWGGRLRQALELIEKARQDVSRGEDNPHAQSPQQRALEHIDRAHRLIKEAIGMVE